jgi:amino acid transporter
MECSSVSRCGVTATSSAPRSLQIEGPAVDGPTIHRKAEGQMNVTPGTGPSLSRRVLASAEVASGSVATVAPSSAVALGPAAVFLVAGNGTWLSELIAMGISLVVVFSLLQFARRTASSGSLATYAGRGLGPAGAYVTGIALMIAYFLAVMSAAIGAAIYFSGFLQQAGWASATGTAMTVVWTLLFTGAGAFLAYRSVRLSARIALVLEALSVLTIGVVLALTLAHAGSHVISHTQLSIRGSSFNGVTQGLVLAMLSFVGFESAASYGAEARHPFRDIPRALVWVVVGIGVLFVVGAYTEVLGFAHIKGGLGASGAPLNVLADADGVHPLSFVLDLGITASLFTCVVGSLNAGSRIFFTQSQEGVFPAWFGAAHPVHGTPYRVILVALPVCAAVPVIFLLYGTTPLGTFAYTGTIETFGYLLAYIVAAAASPAFLRRLRQLTVWPVLAAVATVAAIGYVFYKQLVPVPPSPYDVLPYVFFGIVAVTLVWYLLLRVRKPEQARNVGITFDDEPAVTDPTRAMRG